VFSGLEECIRFIANFKLTEDEIDFVRQSLTTSCEVNEILFFTLAIALLFNCGDGYAY
jgi:nicotinic acid phosphoribosyltransferase